MLTDGRDPTLKKWLEGTNWPEGFEYEHKVKLIKNYIAQEVIIRKGLDKIGVFLNPRKLTRSDYDFFIQSCIKNISDASKITERWAAGKQAIKK